MDDVWKCGCLRCVYKVFCSFTEANKTPPHWTLLHNIKHVFFFRNISHIGCHVHFVETSFQIWSKGLAKTKRIKTVTVCSGGSTKGNPTMTTHKVTTKRKRSSQHMLRGKVHIYIYIYIFTVCICTYCEYIHVFKKNTYKYTNTFCTPCVKNQGQSNGQLKWDLNSELCIR